MAVDKSKPYGPDRYATNTISVSCPESQSWLGWDTPMTVAEEKIWVRRGETPGLGIGGAPTRATTLPESAAERKQFPVASGVLDYFPDAIAAIANLSYVGNEQHNPGKPLHWDRSKSTDEADTMIRHYLQRGSLDTDGIRHTVKMAWRALAYLQKEIEGEK